MEIRKAQIEDAGAIADLLRSLGWFTHLNAEPEETTAERIGRHLALCNADDSHSVYVAEAEGAILGYVAVHWLPYLILAGPEGYISELFLGEAARGQGIGTRLLDVAKQEAETRGCARLRLINNKTRESYQRKFYEKQGWQERDDFATFVYPLGTVH